MSNTYTQLHIHTIFAVQNRESQIQKSWRDRLYQYIIAIIQKHGHKVLSIGGMEDHIHIFFGMRPIQALSELVQEIKRDSSYWINQNHLSFGRFSWQEGYGAFSYAKSQVDSVVKYIQNQELHHSKKSMTEEYISFLDKFGVEYDKRFIFKEIKL